jgi:hypothetical protein
MRVSVAAEKAGIPAISIVATTFLAQARAFAKGLGAADPVIAEYKGVPMIDTDEQLHDKVINSLLPQILEGWSRRTKKTPSEARPPEEPGPRDIVFRGTLAEVQDFFDEKLWADGLPVIPPTLARIQEFFKFTDRSPDDVIGICKPDYREATLWNIAVNGVMAGCRPEYMPVLIAVVEAILDIRFSLEDGGSTPGWEPLIILNGPIIKDLGFNYGGGVMRVGRRANTSIGRFLRLYMRNVAGFRIPAPGVTTGSSDKASIGLSFNVVLAENEDAVAEIGWQPFSVDQGYTRGENVVTVQSVVSITEPTYSAGSAARNHLEIIAEVIGHALHYRAYNGIRDSKWYPLIVMSPSVAKALANDGCNKDDIRKYLYDNVKMTAALVEKYARNSAMNSFELREFVKSGMISSHYYESDDPNRLVRVFIKPEMIGIVVAGDPGRNQSKGYTQNSRQGVPVSKRIRLPENWRERLSPQQKP